LTGPTAKYLPLFEEFPQISVNRPSITLQ